MFKVSEAFNKEINKLQGRKFNAKVIIRDKEYSGNQIYEMNLEESVNPSDSFSIGSICSNSFDIKLINTGDIFDNAIVKPYVGLYIGDDIEYIPLGVFTVIKTSVKGKFINLECVDNMLGLEKVYFSDLSYPADINDIAKEICKKAGVNLASKLPNYRVNKIEGYSLREAIGFIASLCGSFARFNRIGDLEVRDYEVVKQEMTPHNLFKLDIEANECIIKKVIAKKGEEELSTGTDDGNKIVFNNPIITKEILSDIYTKYNGFKYISYTAKWKGNPAIMAGDILNLTDLNGNKYNALIMEQKFTYKNGISSEVKAKGKTRQDSSFDSKGSVAQSMERYSIEQANIKKALIDKASINDLTAVDAKIQRLYTEDLTAIRADIVTLNSQKANIIELNSVRADLQQAIIGKANITDLNAAVGKLNVLESKTASIENALNKNLTAENIATGAITASSGIIAEGAIGDAEISSLSVNKLKAGDITTSKHRIVSADGTIEIVGNQILINRNNVNRVILGEYRKTDGTTDYGLLIRGKDGKTIMLDSDGVHNAGITNGAIDNNKVADNANISGNKLDINSVIREVNNNGTETIKGTKVTVGDRTLDVELSTQNNTITEHSKELSSQKASLTALDNALKFKVDSQTFNQSTTTINNNINRAKEEAINSSNSHADSKVNEALNNAKAFVNSEITNVNTHLNKNTSEINILKGQIESKVSQSDIDKSIQNIEFGGRNLFLKSKGPFKSSNEYVGISITSVVEKYLNKKITISADVKANKVGKIRFYSLGGYSVGFWVERDVTTEWTRIKATGKFTLNDEKQKWCDLSFYGTYGSGLFTEVRNVKIELGELASDYTEAPEDTDKLIIDNIKTVTDKISTVESKLTQENNSIKASVQDLNSTTQSITTNVSNINRDLISKINSNLAVAKNFATDIAIAKANLAREQAIASADGKITEEERKRIQQAQENLDTAIARADKAKQDAINAASTDATNKANNALNSAKAFVNAEITTVNNKVHNVESNIDILKNKIALKVEQSDIDKTKTELINKINVVDNLANNAKDLASAMSLGKMLFSDPTFKNSSNNIKTYNNNGNGTVTTSRISKINGCPTDSQYCIEVKTVGSASPNHGGFYFGNMTRANAIFVTKIIAKIPVGLRIGWYSNSTGNNGSSKWLTSVNGTGKWEEYIHLLKCGDTGSFSSTSFFALDGGGTPTSSNPIIWHIAYATVFDITENDESVNVLKTEMSTAKNKVAIIETNLDSITQRISSTESKTHSIETTLGGKASKQEVAEVNNRIATIKANLDSITQRVSNTESKTNSLETNINGKASKQELTVVNNKVTEVTASLNGITQRVGNTESRINALDGKVAGAVTLQQFTEFKQSNDKFKFTVEQRSSVSNILPNSSFHGGDRGWLHGGNEFWSGPYSGYGFKGRITGAIKNRAAYNNPERYLQTHKAYKVKKNTTYTINFHYICEKNVQSMDAFVVLSDTEHGDYAQPIYVLTAQGGSQSNATEEKPFTYKFNTGNHEWVWIRFDHNGMKSGVNWDEFCWVYVSEIGIYEGDVGAVKWTPKGGEVYSANYQMDGLGFKGTFEDGTYASLGKDGLEWFNAGTGHAYHALTYVTSFDIPIGNPGKAYIKLPAEFTKRRNSLKWTVALRGYYYSTSGDFFPFHIHCTGGRDYIENGLVVCEVQGYCKIQNAQNAGDVQFRPLTAMLIAIA
ncbi:KID repeat family protein [Clostridium perfringens ATCC 13124]|uniref:KID repeat family protein n=1 Tax=Clostridium perfringens (strain ATCC 13124 / DSM 756 / JCM 1290 / NCIMB 6125 / NCTC 8237 / Type A) TaxID=195103 RepID=A0A0H2YV99_CLOP1|nr:KID repeat-containing protein [Clostridium perfringens]ABG85067.1 KID repeat family protein [Clostridium perfringens ATCC 13124]